MYEDTSFILRYFVYYSLLVLLLIWLLISLANKPRVIKNEEVTLRNGEYINDKRKRVSAKPFIIIFLIILGMCTLLNYFSQKTDNERKVNETIRNYIYTIRGADYNPDGLSHFYPPSYITNNAGGVDDVLKKYRTLGEHGVIHAWVGGSNVILEGPSTPSHIEKCNVNELHKRIAITYGTDIDIKCAYKAYVYYSYKIDGQDVGYTVPIICGKIGNDWYILDDSDPNGPLKAANERFGMFDEESFEAQQNVINDKGNPFLQNSVSGFVFDTNGRLTDDEKQKIEEYITEKYKETDDTNQIDDLIDNEMLKKATSPSMAYCRPASDNIWYVRWAVDNEHSEYLNNTYEQIGNAYLINGSVYDRTIHVIDKAYEVYGSY